MKKTPRFAALAALSALAFSSCYYYPTVGGSVYTSSAYGVPVGTQVSYQSNVAWTNASYDAAGIPIYGYSYGQPVYAYTAAGAAIFTAAAITAACIVPDWGYADWYRGSWRYPVHVHHHHAPPRYPKGHRPSYRPAGGKNAAINRHPAQHFKPSKGPNKVVNNNTTIINNNKNVHRNTQINNNHRVQNNTKINNNHRVQNNTKINNNHRTQNNTRINTNHRTQNNTRINTNHRTQNNTKINTNHRTQSNSQPRVQNNTKINSSPRPSTRTNSSNHSSRGGRSGRH